MQFQYFPESDMLYIKLADGISVESEEVAIGFVLDFDKAQQVIGIEIEDASGLTNEDLVMNAEALFLDLDCCESKSDPTTAK
jgi:uncharacterized protein YuzE